jgi:hypothetical protein
MSTSPSFPEQFEDGDMSDQPTNKQQELKNVEEELKKGGVSRRRFLDSMKALGVGFGAAFVLGIKDADALTNLDPRVTVKSTNPAVDDVIKDAQDELSLDQAGEGSEGEFQTAQYFRVYRRGYRRYRRGYLRGYRRYARGYFRGYRRYARGFGRYGRVYRRGYRRLYARF